MHVFPSPLENRKYLFNYFLKLFANIFYTYIHVNVYLAMFIASLHRLNRILRIFSAFIKKKGDLNKYIKILL